MWQLNEGKLLLAGLALGSRTRETQGRACEGLVGLPADRKLFTNSFAAAEGEQTFSCCRFGYSA